MEVFLQVILFLGIFVVGLGLVLLLNRLILRAIKKDAVLDTDEEYGLFYLTGLLIVVVIASLAVGATPTP